MEKETLTVFVDDKPKRIFRGLCAKHAIGSRKAKAVREHRLSLLDADGHRVDVDGACYDGEHLYLVPTTPAEFAAQIRKDALP